MRLILAGLVAVAMASACGLVPYGDPQMLVAVSNEDDRDYLFVQAEPGFEDVPVVQWLPTGGQGSWSRYPSPATVRLMTWDTCEVLDQLEIGDADVFITVRDGRFEVASEGVASTDELPATNSPCLPSY
jgi:hypothetical protein